MSYIKKESVDKILDAAHIVEVIRDFVPDLKPAGSNFKGLSPFVKEKSPSFMVSPVKDIFKDFASGKGGNVVTFLIENGMSYPEAIEYIAKKYNIEPEYDTSNFSVEKVKTIEEKEKLRKVLTLVHDLYKIEYKNLPPTHPARIEVEVNRKYNQDTIIERGICYAPENFIYDKLKASGYLKEGEALGLIGTNETTQNKYDRFSNRVLYPIHDKNGLLIGFGGRNITERKVAKWINSPDSLLYNKSVVWYGFHQAKNEIRKRGEAFITEGYNDVISAQNYDLPNTIAGCGTGIPITLINELKKLTTKAVFWMDPDRAGMEAVLKYIPIFIQQGFTTEVIIRDFDPDDFTRNHEKEILDAPGLQKLFSKTGARKDGFALLIDEYIKKDFIHLEEEIEIEKGFLEDFISEFNELKTNLHAEINKKESKLLVESATLNSIAHDKTKKSDEFKAQNLLVSNLKSEIATDKLALKNLKEPEELVNQKSKIAELKKEFDFVFKNSEINRAIGAKKICSDIIWIQDESKFEIYTLWIQKESGVSKSKLNSWIKELRSEKETVIDSEDYSDYEYELPADVLVPFKELEQDIKMYGLFMANNKIYFSNSLPLERKVYFAPMSNFEIEILQHMADEKFPALLIRMKNVMNNETIFDCPTETFNSLIRFKDILSKHHNFIFKGKNDHLEKLQIFLFNKMGKGVKLDVLGQQIDGDFFVFNNGIIIDAEERPIDENGRIIIDKTHYYIASANKIYKNNQYKYRSEKSFKIIKNKRTFYEVLTQAAKVHRHHYISPLLYGITCLFRDIVVEANNSFPILFLYGQGGTGKDELGRLIMSLTGIPQKPISLEAELSTQKATIRVLAQFRNGIIMFSEYKRGNQKQDGALKGIYDLLGYSIGTIESKFSTDYIPVEAGLILTGNEFPETEPLLQRLVWNQMDKNVFTQKEKDNMEILKGMTSDGISGFAVELLKHRKLVKENFSADYKKWSAILTPIFPEVPVRIVNNLSVIAAFYEIFSKIDTKIFPFTQFEMIDHFKIGVEQQMYRINSTSILVKFWDCFISSFKGNIENRIQAKKIVNIEGSSLYIQWTHVYSKIQIQWFMIHKEAAPKKEVVLEELKKIPNLYVGYHDTYSFDTGRKAVRSSAIELNIKILDAAIKNDIIGAFMEQIYSESLFGNHEMENIEQLYNDATSTNDSDAKPIELPENLK